MCKEGMWELFSLTLLVEVEVAMLKYGSLLHFLKSSRWRRKRSPHVRSRLPRLAGPGETACVRDTCVNGLDRDRDTRSA